MPSPPELPPVMCTTSAEVICSGATRRRYHHGRTRTSRTSSTRTVIRISTEPIPSATVTASVTTRTPTSDAVGGWSCHPAGTASTSVAIPTAVAITAQPMTVITRPERTVSSYAG